MSDSVSQIGKYRILDRVGEGAMGVVYKAIDPVLNRPVAIKVMSEGMAQDNSLRERFLREAQAAGSLQHPNVVTIYDFGETDGHLFIAMEFIEGTDLEQLLVRGQAIPLEAKLDIIVDVLNGLSYAHRRGLVHRDIKPANIRIDAEGHARIMDFGVVHLSTSNLTGTGVMMGTPNYMAPENITGDEVTPASDLFSVGAVMYELLTNAKPFAADTLHRVLFRIVSDPPPNLLDADPTLPPALDRVLKKALAKDPGERYANATEMANDISAIRASLGAPRASRTVSQRSSIEASLNLQREARQRRSRRLIIAGAAAASVAIVALSIALINAWRSRAALVYPASPGAIVQGAPDTTHRALPSAPNLQGQTAAAAPTPPVANAAQPRDTTPRQVATQQRTTNAGARQVAAQRPTSTQLSVPNAGAAPGAGSSQPVSSSAQQSPVLPPASPIAPPPTVSTLSPAPPASVRLDSAPPVATPAPDPRIAITTVVRSYARAIGTRDVAEVRQVYPGMTSAQQSAWESFFGSVRSMTATFDISALDVSGSSAVAKMTGSYEFVTRAGRNERQPASFEATFVRDGDRWRLQQVR